MFTRTTQTILVKVQEDFKPKVRIGQRVTPKTILGYGQALIVLEEYPITHETKLLVQDGMYVLKGTKLLETKGLFDKVEAVADNDGLVQITDTMLQIIQTVDNHEYRSLVKGVVTAVTPKHIQIEARFLRIPLVSLHTNKRQEGLIKSILKKDSLITNNDIHGVSKKIVIISSPLTLQIAFKAYREGAAIILAPSVDIDVYEELTRNYPFIRFGIMQGFGTQLLWDILYQTFTQLDSLFSMVDPGSNTLLITDKILKLDKNFLFVFKDTEWGTEYRHLRKSPLTKADYNRLGASKYEVFRPASST